MAFPYGFPPPRNPWGPAYAGMPPPHPTVVGIIGPGPVAEPMTAQPAVYGSYGNLSTFPVTGMMWLGVLRDQGKEGGWGVRRGSTDATASR